MFKDLKEIRQYTEEKKEVLKVLDIAIKQMQNEELTEEEIKILAEYFEKKGIL